MRISTQSQVAIKKHILAALPNSEVFLFGSRANDSLKGGDIDLLLLTPEKVPLMLLHRISGLIINGIGEQKIDLVNFRKSDEHPFMSLAIESAVCL